MLTCQPTRPRAERRSPASASGRPAIKSSPCWRNEPRLLHAMAALLFFLLLPLLLLPLAGNLPVVVVGKPHIERDLIMVDLQDYGSGVGTFAVRPDVFSVAGFANRTGHWHALRGNEHLFVGREATPLPFGSSYDGLVGGVNNLLGLPLGEPFRSYATVVLSGYDATAGDDEAAVKRALATLAVVICEGQRLHPIIETILTGRGARVAAEHLPYIEHWDAMWEELKRWRRSGGVVWDGPFTGELRERANIGSAEEALAIVGWTFRHLLLGDGSIPAMCRAEL